MDMGEITAERKREWVERAEQNCDGCRYRQDCDPDIECVAEGVQAAILADLDYAEQAREREAALRPAVRWFAVEMEARLRANDHKTGWLDCADGWLLGRLREETEEVAAELLAATADTRHAEAVIREAADVANFAMMIADKARAALAALEADQPKRFRCQECGEYITEDELVTENGHARAVDDGRGNPEPVHCGPVALEADHE